MKVDTLLGFEDREEGLSYEGVSRKDIQLIDTNTQQEVKRESEKDLYLLWGSEGDLYLLWKYNTLLNQARKNLEPEYIERIIPLAVDEFAKLKEHGLLKFSVIDIVEDEDLKMIIIPCYDYLLESINNNKVPFSTDSLSANYIWRVLNIIIDSNIQRIKDSKK